MRKHQAIQSPLPKFQTSAKMLQILHSRAIAPQIRDNMLRKSIPKEVGMRGISVMG